MKKMSSEKILKATRAVIDKRLDHALMSLLSEAKKEGEHVLSRAVLTRLIKEGAVTVNGKKTKPHYLLRAGDQMKVCLPKASKPQKTHIFSSTSRLKPRKVFENSDFLVLDKPAHLLVHPTPNSSEETLAHFLSAAYPKARKVGEDPLRPGIVHRLDRETSGLIVLAKNQKTYQALKKLFQARKVEKTYLALVYGSLPALSGEVTAPLTRRSGALKRSLARTEKELAGARPARTEYRVIKRFFGHDLVLAFPKTGRTHQIRVHLASLGHPVVGDKLYAFRSQRQGKKDSGAFPTRHLLHAWRLSFGHKGENFTFEAPLPEDFWQAIRDIDPSTNFDEASFMAELSAEGA